MDPAVKKETGYIVVWVVLLSLVMEGVFLIIGQWDLSVLFGNLGGAAVAAGGSGGPGQGYGNRAAAGMPRDLRAPDRSV